MSGHGSLARIVPAFGQQQSIWQWSRDPRCFISLHGLGARITSLGREPDEADVEAAMCFTTSLWRHYRRDGVISERLLRDELRA